MASVCLRTKTSFQFHYYSLHPKKIEHIYHFWPSTKNRSHSFMKNFQHIITLHIIPLTLLLTYFFSFSLTFFHSLLLYQICIKTRVIHQLLYFLGWREYYTSVKYFSDVMYYNFFYIKPSIHFKSTNIKSISNLLL